MMKLMHFIGVCKTELKNMKEAQVLARKEVKWVGILEAIDVDLETSSRFGSCCVLQSILYNCL